MKVIQIYKPLQDDKTKLEDLELVEFITKTEDDFKNPGTIITKVEKKIPYWCVKSEMLKPNETYQEWLKRVEEKINTHSSFKEKGVEGIYFYDMQPIGVIMMVSDVYLVDTGAWVKSEINGEKTIAIEWHC